jgi:hypothetical protein
MTWNARWAYSRPMNEGWQHKGAFVIQFRPETDIQAGRIEGRVEHIASYDSTRFFSLEELLCFIAIVLAKVQTEFQELDQG